MKILFLIFLLTSGFALTSFTRTKDFPEINYKTIDGKSIDNDFLIGKRTIVIMAHLGCPPAMLLLKDLENLTTNKFQTVIILENTTQQVHDFNSSGKNDWSGIRNYYHLNPLRGNIIAECETQSIKYSEENIVIGTQCRKLAKKIRTRDSPTLVYVDEMGNITKIIKGYFGDSERGIRVRKLLEEQ